MSNGGYLPRSEPGKREWLENLAVTLPRYTGELELPDAANVVARVARHAKNFGLVLDGAEAYDKYSSALVALKVLMRDSDKTGGAELALPKPPEALVFETPVVAGIFEDTSRIVSDIKRSKKYNEAIGKELRILPLPEPGGGGGEEQPRPVIAVELQTGRPNILWRKGRFDGIKIHVDRGSGKFEFLAIDTHPDYLDTYPLPELGKSEIWRYMAIYMKKDEPIGDWSEIVQVTVTGRPA
jgi:hypothetical protein